MNRVQAARLGLTFIVAAAVVSAIWLLLACLPMEAESIDQRKSNGKHNMSRAVTPTWTIETVDCRGDVWCQHTSLNLDALDQPHIGYFATTIVDEVAYADLRYASRSSGVWVTETVTSAGCYDYPLSSLSLALDSSGHPHIGYHYFDPAFWPYVGGHMMYTWYDGDQWHGEMIEEGESRLVAGAFPSLAIDSNGKPHLAYFVLGGNNGDSILRYATRVTSTWTFVSLETMPDAADYCVSLALDSANLPHIGYYHGSSDPVKHAWSDGMFWHTETVTIAIPVGSWDRACDLAVDEFDNPHIAFLGGDWSVGDYELNHVWHEEDHWQIETVEPVQATYLSLVSDSEGNLHSSYYESAQGIKYAVREEGAWQKEMILVQDWRGYNSLAVSGRGNPHISFCGSPEAGLQYAYRETFAVYDIHLPLVVRDTMVEPPELTGNINIIYINYDGSGDQEPDEYVEIRNDDSSPIQVQNWTLSDEENHVFDFPAYVMSPAQVCRVYTNEDHPVWCGFSYANGAAIWNNEGDCAYLRDSANTLIDEYCY